MPEEAVMDPPAKGMTAQEKNAEYNEKVEKRERRQSAMQAHAASATIYRVGYVNEKVSIEYSLIENNTNNDFTLASDDVPCEAFLNALHSLAPHIAKMINWHPDEQAYQTKHLTVKSVTLKYHSDNNLHASIAVTRALESGHCFTFNTPMLPLESLDPHAASLGKEMADILRALIDEAKAYIGGKRSQGTLPFPDDEEDFDDIDDEYESDDVADDE